MACRAFPKSPAHPFLLAALLASPCAAKELSEADFLGELPVVLTASRLAQPLMDAPAAITVIDRQMIDASGFREIADLFRLVPGFYVGYFTGNQPFVSNALISEFARGMQVLVDGRSVYLPSIGGVLWSALPVSMEDIERIEVTRGPNAASHGANAFTGVINIITRHPQDVAGQTVRLASGDKGVRIGTWRWAGGERVKNRMTLEYRRDDGFDNRNDYVRAPLFNYRGEYEPTGRDSFSWQLGYMGGDRGAGFAEVEIDQPHNQEISSHFQQFNWTTRQPGAGEMAFGIYHNHTLARELATNSSIPFLGGSTILAGQRISADLLADRWNLEFQHTLEPANAVRVVWGGSLRSDSVWSPYFYGTAETLANRSWTLFGHVEKRLSPAWLLNAGAMLERHDIGGFSASPRLSVHWQPTPENAFRASLSRASRYPVQFEENADNVVTLNASLPPLVLPVSQILFRSSGGLRPERITASEIGYLGNWPSLNASLDLRFYHWEISDIIGSNRIAAAYTVMPGVIYNYFYSDPANKYSATLQGADMQLKWHPREGSRLIANFSTLHSEGSNASYAASAPVHLAGLLLSQRLPGNVAASMGYYWTGDFLGMGRGDALESSRRMDLRLSVPIKTVGMKGEVALTMQNLSDEYLEFNRRNLFSRRAYLQLKLDF